MSTKLLVVLFSVIAMPVALVAYAYHSRHLFLAVMFQHALAATIGVLAFFFNHPKLPTIVPVDPPDGRSLGGRFPHSASHHHEDVHKLKKAA